MYAVLAQRCDCGEPDLFLMEDSRGRDHWPSLEEARNAMKADYLVTVNAYHQDPSKPRDRSRKCALRKMSAYYTVPLWDGERMREGRLECKWKVVRV